MDNYFTKEELEGMLSEGRFFAKSTDDFYKGHQFVVSTHDHHPDEPYNAMRVHNTVHSIHDNYKEADKAAAQHAKENPHSVADIHAVGPNIDKHDSWVHGYHGHEFSKKLDKYTAEVKKKKGLPYNKEHLGEK
jgi:hypothetical protein